MGSARSFDYIVVTPSGTPEPALAIAASRAGALGVLNLEFSHDTTMALAALQRLITYGHGRCGVLIAGDADELLSLVVAQPWERLDTILVTSSRPEGLSHMVESIHGSGRQAYVVVTSQQDAERGHAAGADGLIAKGHEAGGWVGDETTFVLLQRLVQRFDLPIFAQGGVGLHTAAACYVAGAAGCVLDNQLLLAHESPLPKDVRTRIAMMDGSETLCVGSALGAAFRVYTRPSLGVVDKTRQLETSLTITDRPAPVRQQEWREALHARVDWQDAATALLAIGQDAALAARLATRFGTVGAILSAMRQAVKEHCAIARDAQPLAEGSPLARSHGTRFPIVQGPMTRVSDRAEFAVAVAESGALPFVALALMRGPEVKALLEETQQRMGARPWGVGILAFVPSELRAEQLEVVRAIRPPFAVIAGGRPDQAQALERENITSYLHVPSPGLLGLFLQEGARRFIFEGRECGGHVGPRTSFVLWEAMIDTLLSHLPADVDPAEYHVLFAGGVHDGLSAAMVAALAAPLVQRGIRIGVLIGTAYLFTEEAVQAGAIVPAFQQAALDCEHTVLLESGPGHATRCAPSPFVSMFGEEKRRLLHSGVVSEELREQLEELNIGRLRIASKGVDRNPAYADDPMQAKLIPVSAQEQVDRGMYMIGQVAALRHQVCTAEELHAQISEDSVERLAALVTSDQREETPAQAAIAIVGVGCILPGAPDAQAYWANIINKVDAVTEVPADRWEWQRYFDTDRHATDKIYSRWGGYIADVPFDPVTYGMPPSSLPSIEPFQLLSLAVVRAALQDAGYLDHPFPRERTSVVLGAGGGAGDLTSGYIVRSSLATLFGDRAGELIERLGDVLPEWTEDSFPGFLMNVASGRVANRFDLGGANYTVDAACASSLAAVYLAVRDLEARTSDMAIVGGLDAIQNPFIYTAFGNTQALSPSGRCRPFDAAADGIAISEGFGALVLKRLDDAERDGDRVYAVIRGMGASSDGRARGLTAPRPEGQVRALRRAYAQAGFSAATVSLIEAHGTGTVAGDQAEAQSLGTLFEEAGAERQRCAVGSVKSMIGHTKATAGVASLIKIALALHHRVLPPTLGVTTPNPKTNFPASPFYVNSETRPWIRAGDSTPRRAGVSAFGFGGTNFHAVLEEYTGDYLQRRQPVLDPWPAELFVWRGSSRQDVAQDVSSLLASLEQGAQPRLGDLAYTLLLKADALTAGLPTLAIVATSLDDLRTKLLAARTVLTGSDERQHTPQGLHFADRGFGAQDQVAFLFPGQGSQYPNMMRDVAVLFPEARTTFERADAALTDQFVQPLSRFVFPPPGFTEQEEQRQQAELTETNIAQPALGAADMAMFHLLRTLGVQSQMVAGHSYGEFVALYAAGVFDEETLLLVSEARGRFIREGAGENSGAMAAVEAEPAVLTPLLAGLDVTLANMNSPQQTVVSGTRDDVEAVVARCAAGEIRARMLPVSCAFHSPLVAPAQARLAEFLHTRVTFTQPHTPVYSNTTAEPYPHQTTAIADLLSSHLVRPVEFVRQITAMHQAGARVFVEVGPRSVLTGLVTRILDGQPHVAVALDQPGRHGLVSLLHGLAALMAEGIAVHPERLYEGRSVRRLDLTKLEQETGQPRYTPTTWLVNGSRSRPAARVQPGTSVLPLPIYFEGQADHVAPTLNVNSADSRPMVLAPAPATNGPVGNGYIAPIGPVASAWPVGVPATPTSPSPQPSPSSGSRPLPPHKDDIPMTAQPDIIHHVQSRPPVIAAVERVSPSSLPGNASEVMIQFQVVMQRFLTTQQNVMLSYLQGSVATASPSASSRPSAGVAPVYPTAPPLAPAQPVAGGSAYLGDQRLVVEAPAPRSGGNGYSDARQLIMPQPSAPAAPAPEATPRPTATPITAPPGNNGHGAAPAVAAAPRLEPAAPAPVAAAAAAGIDVEGQLLSVISDRTGYPAEMLGLDVDLEADLGIDSIKRVEIVGTVVRQLSWPGGVAPEMEKLTSSRTLRQLRDRLLAAQAPANAPGTVAPAAPAREASKDEAAIHRFVVRPSAAPPIRHTVGLARDGVIVLIDDLNGVADHLATRLQGQNYQVARVVAHVSAPSGPDTFVADISRPDEVEQLVAHLHARYGQVSGLVHLTALHPGSQEVGVDVSAWQARLSVDLQGLFLLTQALQADLESAARSGGSVVVAATDMGGAFALDHPTGDFFAGHSGAAGYLKCFAQEAPSVRVKAVDLDRDAHNHQQADQLLAEMMAADGLVEVGYHGGRRMMLTLAPAPLATTRPTPPLDQSSVVLLTGGARGITAEVALTLAERYRPTLLLVGRTALPAGQESALTAGLADALGLKRAIIEQLRQAGQPLTPVKVEETYRRLLREREVRQNMARLQNTGARVEYLVCDVSDEQAFGALIADIYSRHGHIDGLVHGAGVVEDKLVRDKTLDSFQRVLDIKVQSSLTIARKLRPEQLRFAVFFSSIAGRLGNRGQSDYAAANEILSKLAVWLGKKWPNRVVAVEWGPWAMLGMATPEIQKQFSERGIATVPPQIGCDMLLAELEDGPRGDSLIVIAGGSAVTTGQPGSAPQSVDGQATRSAAAVGR